MIRDFVLWCFFCGCVSGVLYDVFKSLRCVGFNSSMAVIMQDILFWTIETLWVFFVIFYANDNVLRWHIFFFILFGFAAYRYLLSKYTLALMIYILKVIIKVFLCVVSTVLFPLKLLKKVIKRYRKSKIMRLIRRKITFTFKKKK